MSRRALLLATAVGVALASGASADTSLYLELNGGASVFEDVDIDDRGAGQGTIAFKDPKFNEFRDLGFNGGGAIGVTFHSESKHRFRTELNGSYRRVRIDDIEVNGVRLARSGSASLATGMLNGFYEHDFGDLAWVRAFIGGGVGAGLIEFEKGRSGNTFILDDDSVEFAWNASAGLVLPLGGGVELTGAYRLVSLADPELTGMRVNASGAVTSRGPVDVEVFSHEVVFGLRANF